LVSFALIGGFLLFRFNKGIEKEKFIRTDCQFYEADKMTVEEYFAIRNDYYMKGIMRPQNNIETPKTTEKDDINTTRELKETKEIKVERRTSKTEKKDKPKFRELNELEEINDNKLKVENNPAPPNEIILHGNFMETKNDTKTTIGLDNNNKPNIITLKDYEALDSKYMPMYDLRPTHVYLRDEVFNKHRLFIVLTKQSIMDPVIIRSTKLMFHLSSSLASNALLFTDGYIEARLKHNKVK
jgi:hypothetical protein